MSVGRISLQVDKLAMRAIVSILLLAASVAGCGWFQSKRTTVAHQLRDTGLEQAKQEGKRLFLWFATIDSEFCDLMDRFHADPEVAKLLGQHFIQVKIDVIQTPGGEELYLETGHNRGVPAFAIMDEKGIIVADSGSLDQASNIGFPTSDEELDRYEVALKTACPELTEAELKLLRRKLQEVHEAYKSALGEDKPVVETEPKTDSLERPGKN